GLLPRGRLLRAPGRALRGGGQHVPRHDPPRARGRARGPRRARGGAHDLHRRTRAPVDEERAAGAGAPRPPAGDVLATSPALGLPGYRPAMARLSKLNRSIAGRTALVTGAASGMGRATAHLFSDEGAQVAVVDRAAEGVEAVVGEI